MKNTYNLFTQLDELNYGPQSDDRILRLSKVISLTGISESTIRRLEERDLFPPRRQLTERAVGWLQSEILAWINTRGLTDEKYPPWTRDDK